MNYRSKGAIASSSAWTFYAREVLITVVLACSVLLGAVLLLPPKALGAFDLIPVKPEERGLATPLALGSAGEVMDSTRAGRAASVCIFGFRPFGLSEIDFAAVSIEIPVGLCLRNVALSYGRLDVFGYREEVCAVSVALGAGRAVVTPRVRVCIARADEGFSDWALLFDLAAETQVSGMLRTRAYLDNPLGSGLVRSSNGCPKRIGAGVGARVAPDLTFGIEIGKTVGFATSVASGAEFAPVRGLKLRVGLRTCPKEFTFGAGARIGRIALDAATSISPALGATHEAGATFFW